MASNGTQRSSTILSSTAEWLADREGLPTSIRALLGYYADTGEFDLQSIKLKWWVDSEISRIIDEAFEHIETNIEADFDQSGVDFEYDTKLTLPAELTLGYIYRTALDQSPSEFNPVLRKARTEKLGYARVIFDTKRQRRRNERLKAKYSDLVEEVGRAENLTKLVIEALIDGDMRDALNDDEYEDFKVNFTLDNNEEKRKLAQVAQNTLKQSIEEQFEQFPDEVLKAYESAVEISEGHQAEDQAFRELMDRDEPIQGIRSDYKYASFDEPPEVFHHRDLELPYFKTQYDRVGVIYDGMIDMYRGAGFEINDDFKRSIILAIIAAQIWLDDVSDYEDDREEQQLTPVTAEYLLNENDANASENITEIVDGYISRSKHYARKSGTPLTGIAIEYIYREGEPSVLPT